MRVIIVDSYEQMGLEAANIVAGQIYLKPGWLRAALRFPCTSAWRRCIGLWGWIFPR